MAPRNKAYLDKGKILLVLRIKRINYNILIYITKRDLALKETPI